MLSLEEAVAKILPFVQPLPSERVPLRQACGRILREAVNSTGNLPAWDNSAMDGYAVRAGDTATATNERPISLRQIGRAAAGEVFSGELTPGNCVRVFTGSLLPAGADAVVMQEDTRCDATDVSTILVTDRVRPWENIRFRGEDVKAGETLLATGERLNATQIGLLAATGVSEVQVSQRPRIGLLATGNELVEAGQSLQPGQVFESNRAMLAAVLETLGCEALIYGLVRDNLPDTQRALDRAFTECDAVITSGGASVGEMDFVKAALEAVGGTLDFWRVAIKPGKPFVFGHRSGKCLFGLPGNPVAAFVTSQLLVRPALLRMMAAQNLALPVHPGILAEALSNSGDRRHFMRVQVDGSGNVSGAGGQASHLLHALACGNGLVDVPPKTTLSAGATVQVLMWER